MLYLLWDEAHLWGVLMLRALRAWSLPFRLVRAHELAGGLLSAAPPSLLAVPGGFASRKAASLGQAGARAVRSYVSSGGAYLGICGGSGLGLSVPGGLGLCPFSREPFEHRLQHFASGAVELIPGDGPFTPEGFSGLPERPLAPVWWPAKFRTDVSESGAAPDAGRAVEVVAAYGKPGPGFMMADIPFSLLPRETLDDWEALYGVKLSPAFAEGDPCIVSGSFGQGRYVLSHAHLETPDSPQANAWLAHILAGLSGRGTVNTAGPGYQDIASGPEGPLAAAGLNESSSQSARPAPLVAPAWAIGRGGRAWDDPALVRAMELMLGAVELGREHGLLTWREPWLLGWRQGLPGAQLSGVLAMLDCAMGLTPSQEALRFFERRRKDFSSTMELLAEGLSGYLLAERLAMTLARVDPEAVPARGLGEAKATLFGPPPGLAGGASGGLCGRALSVLEECIFLTLSAC